MYKCSSVANDLLMSEEMNESSVSSASSLSPSEGEYLLPSDNTPTDIMANPVFDVCDWNPEPPAGLDFVNILPDQQGYESLHKSQRNPILKITSTMQHRRDRRKEFSSGKTIGKGIHDEKRLRQAVQAANYKLVEELLESGVEPSCVDDKKRSSLHIAAAMGDTTIVKLLLQQGANPNQRDIIGNTPLHLAACTNHVQVITLLLQAGTDVNMLDNAGNSPLHLACSRLNLLRALDQRPSAEKLKQEVTHILDMMREYMIRRGSKTDDLEELDDLGAKLSKVTTSDDFDEVSLLLTGFANLQIKKQDTG